MSAAFVHLNVHTEYSLAESIVRIPALMDELKQQHANEASNQAANEVADGDATQATTAIAPAAIAPATITPAAAAPAVALTDLHNMFALVKFYRRAISNGLKPLIGVDARVSLPAALDGEKAAHSRVILLAQNDEGYRNLTRLVSRSYQEGQQQGCPLVERDWLFHNHQGLIALSGGVAGEVALPVARGRRDLATALADEWQATFGNRFYLELCRTGRAGEEEWIDFACELAMQKGIAPVATNDVCFINRADFAVHEARLCIQHGYVLADSSRPSTHSEEQYLKSPAEMIELFADIPEAITNSVHIAERCNLDVSLGQPVLPDFPIPDGMTENEYLSQQSEQGLDARLEILFADDPQARQQQESTYRQRLQRELGVIIDMGFPGYFLIVADFIRWARENGVPVGPGRGSGAGSLVAYALGITDLDPLKYDLLFERFLNPERVSMPDFDIDFCMDGRDRVIQYVSETYGEHRVSQIITYGTMAAKAVVRDVGRVMGHPYGFVDRIAKMVPFEVGMTLDKALAESEELSNARRDDEEVSELLDMALSLEGIARNAGKHAGGVVIAPTALTDFTPLYCEPDGNSLVTQFDKDDAEAVGLVKFDFLGLRTLTIIETAVNLIKRLDGDAAIDPGEGSGKSSAGFDINDVALDDKATYELLQRAATTAVFQLESPGMKRLIERLRPDNFEDIIALVALYRPGPLQSGMVDDFIDRKHGRKQLAWPHEDYQLESLKPTLEPTYGVILYQEQVIQIAQVMAGFTLGRSDLLRRAMGKKKPEEMAKQRIGFLDGCDQNGIDRHLAGNIFDLVEKFAGYGFNKSHSAAYALLSYQTAWLKTHHPAAFMCAVLSADMDNTDKVVGLIEECAAMGLTVRSPDINTSKVDFDVINTSTIRYGLGAIKGVGEAALADFLAERDANGAYRDLESLCRRQDAGNINKRVLEALIRSGAADALGENRATMMGNLPATLRAADQYHRDKDSGQSDLFGLVEADEATDTPAIPLQTFDEWAERELLRHEKETLGLYLSGHPISDYLDELSHFTSGRLNTLCAKAQDQAGGSNQGWRPRGVSVLLAGLIIGIRYREGQNGRMVIATLDDRSGRVDAILDGELLERAGSLLQAEEVLVVDGELSVDDFNGGYRIRARDVWDMGTARDRFARRLVINIAHSRRPGEAAEAGVVGSGELNGSNGAMKTNGVSKPANNGSHGPNGSHAVASPIARDAPVNVAGNLADGLAGGLADTVEQMLTTLSAYKSGNIPVCFDYCNGEASARIRAGDQWLVRPDSELIDSLKEIDSEASVELLY